MSIRLYLWGKRPLYLLHRRMGGLQSTSGCCRKAKNLSSLLRIKPQFLGCLVCSHKKTHTHARARTCTHTTHTTQHIHNTHTNTHTARTRASANARTHLTCPSARACTHAHTPTQSHTHTHTPTLTRTHTCARAPRTHAHTYLSFIFAKNGCGCQCHSLATYPRKEIRYPLYWAGHTARLDSCKNLEQAGMQSTDSPACSESLFLCRQYGSLEQKRGKESEKNDRQHTVSPGFQICYSVQTVTHTHTHTHTQTPFFHFCSIWVWVLNASPWPLYPRKEIKHTFYWAGPRAGLDSCRKSRVSQDSNPRQSSL